MTRAKFRGAEQSERRSILTGRWVDGEGHKKGGRGNRPHVEAALFALFGFQFREPFEDESVCLVGQLGDERQIVATVAVCVVIVLGVVHVGPGEGHVEELLLVGFVLPHGGFDAAETEGLHRKFGPGGGVLGLRGGLSDLGGHDVSFLI